MTKKRVAAVGALAAAALLLAGCVPGTGSAPKADSSAASTKDTLVWAQTVDPRNLDPQNAVQTSADRVNRNIYDRLFTRDASMKIVPQLVKDYKQVDDTTWNFTLRQDVKFQDGSKLTAKDAVFTIHRLKDPSLLEARWYQQILEATQTGEYSFQLKTDGPMPTLMAVLAKSGADIVPADFIEKNGIEAFIKAPFGSGPYKFTEWKRDDRVILDRNDGYWGGKPKWKHVEVRTIPENSTRVSELLTGGVDIATDVPVIDWKRVNGDKTRMSIGETSRVMLLVLRLNSEYATKDPRVREAIDLAIDKKSIVKTLFNGEATPTRTRAPKAVFGGDPKMYDTSVYDPKKAKELVDKVKADGGDVSLHYSASRGTYPMDAELAEMVNAMLTKAGFKVDLEILEGGAFGDIYSKYTNKAVYQVAFSDALLDASYSLQGFATTLGMPRMGYSNATVDDLLSKANRTMDQNERKKDYAQVQEIIAEKDRPLISLYAQPSAYGTSKSVKFTPRADDAFVFDDVTPAK
ncbi:ABC transporter substrate-binding protein [Microbacterium sp. ASV81]|uniref:ABC transporter substrate-binding protein n=1 Tax=Microbacterium capsulatum TaxID=3041921 RepID=A0ABU0XIL0_9MICO|nr:ABC transporter substrate-binding protein [Microbacterium sp. ASV81]MDQ4214975.1 ABC transporter substrate-binding protein [Microbacterium sp. ASV81]